MADSLNRFLTWRAAFPRPALLLLMILVPGLAPTGWAAGVSGNIGSEATFHHGTGRGELIFGAEVEIETPRYEGWRAEAEFEADSSDRTVRLYEAFFDGKTAYGRFSAGLKEKNLGLETTLSGYEKPGLKDSLLYQYLKQWAYVGNEIMLEWQGNCAKESDGGTCLIIALGNIEATDMNLRVLIDNKAQERAVNVLGSAIVTRDEWHTGIQHQVYALLVSFYSTLPVFNYQLELLHGLDPVATEWSYLIKENQEVQVWGGKLLASMNFLQHYEAFAAFSQLNQKERSPAFIAKEIQWGLNARFDEKWRIGIGSSLVTERFDVDGATSFYSTKGSRSFCEVKAYF
jgi:hypothetical protein